MTNPLEGFKRVDYQASHNRYDGYAYSDNLGNTYFGLTEQEAMKKHQDWGIPPFWITDEDQPDDHR